MSTGTLPRRICVLGTGTIGTLMAQLFLRHGICVAAHDPNSGALERFLADVTTAGVGADRVTLHASIEDACRESECIFEAGPERLAIKREILRLADAAAPASVVIATATSSLLVSDLQGGLYHPERVVAAHPFNPPHLVPLVEVAGSKQSAEWALRYVVDLFSMLGRRPIRLRREAIGHIANRLTAALYREAVSIVSEGIASVADVDDAVRFGPGIRWAVMGPHMLYHLGAGSGGYAKYLDHLGPTQEARWNDLGSPQLTPAVTRLLVAGVEAEASGRSIEVLSRQRDAALVAILEALGRQEIFSTAQRRAEQST